MRIVFHCGESLAPWSPRSCETGVGGSEEALIELARRLGAMGHEVLVYNSCGADAGMHGPVEYHDVATQPPDACDILIVWRNLAMPARLSYVRAARRYLWLQNARPEELVLEQERHFDKLMVVSKFHRSVYPRLSDDRIFETANRIDPAHFEQPAERDPRRVVFASSYDRGLKIVLRNWRRVEREIPGVSLMVFFGWQSLRKWALRSGQGWRGLSASFLGVSAFQLHMALRMRALGVEHAGRVGHREVARRMLSSGVWAYPCTLPEVSCITAMKAQAAGAVPVVIALAALKETVRFGFRTARDSGEIAEKEWLEGLIEMLRRPEKQEAIRGPMMAEARERFSWDRIARQWRDEFQGRG
ncbi:MAG: hypothetical protein ACRD44_14435 [Bryobacteraceae bacterium]